MLTVHLCRDPQPCGGACVHRHRLVSLLAGAEDEDEPRLADLLLHDLAGPFDDEFDEPLFDDAALVDADDL